MTISKKLRNYRTGDPAKFETDVTVTLTDTHLTFDFYCKNSKFYSAGQTYNSDVFNGDACEAFICTDGSLKHYFEIEVAPNNCVFLMKITNNGNGDLILDPIDECFVVSEVEICGDDYKCKFTVPLDKIGYDKEKGILFNAFRIETEGGISDKNLFAWQPACSNTFHCPEFFVKL